MAISSSNQRRLISIVFILLFICMLHVTGLRQWSRMYVSSSRLVTRSVSSFSPRRMSTTDTDLDLDRYSSKTTNIPQPAKRSMTDQVQAASIASAAAMAAAAVNAAVSMKPLSAPDATKSFVYKDGAAEGRIGKVDEVGLPLVYDRVLIEAYWKKQGSALTQRWTEFLGYAVPFLTKVITILVTGGSDELKANGAQLARDARIIFEKLVCIFN